MIVNSDTSEKILSDLGENPRPEELYEYTKEKFFLAEPNLVELTSLATGTLDHVITLKSYEDQDNFYDEMESSGSRGFAPSRIVACTDRMPTCRSTQYQLSMAEAKKLANDPRVHAIELAPHLTGRKIVPFGFEYSDGWSKDGTNSSNMKNWGLLRCVNGQQIPDWGVDGQQNQVGGITTTASGLNVDCVVFDGNIPPDHPEYARNADGTGGSRVNQFNWWSLNPVVTGQPAGTYNYTAGSAGNNGHGTHVAGIMAGNTCGWAQNANIYNISPYGEQTNGTSTPNLTQLVNYIRTWHRNKAINPATGRVNPTVVNMSFGFLGNYFPKNGGLLYSNQFVYRGVTTNHPATAPAGQTSLQAAYNGNWTPQQWYNGGVQLFKFYIDVYGVILFFYADQDAAADAAIIDGIGEGIIWCAAAGNNYDEAGMVNTSPDYNNTLNLAYAQFGTLVLYSAKYHNRLPSPAHATRNTFGAANYQSIAAVGNIGAEKIEQLDDTSQSGSRITIFAPGTNIMSSYNAAGVADPRNPAYYLAKLTGTSMASPQVAGYMATVAENYPNLTQDQAMQYMAAYQQTGAITDPSIPLPPGPVSYRGLRGASNQYLRYVPDRPVNGMAWPQQSEWLRPSTGAVYPRVNQQYRPVQ